MTLGLSLGSNPITGVYVGSTAATGVYVGATKVWPASAAAAIVPVGSKATSQNAVSGSGVTSLTLACTLPAGCQAGDVVVLTCSAQQARSFAWVKPTGATSVLDSTLIGSAGVFAVYTYTLTSADVTAGTVGVPCTLLASSTVGTAVIVDAYRTVSDSNLDVVGALATGTLGASPASIPASGITTTKPGDVLQYSVCVGNAVVSMSASAPSGWTNGDAIFAANNAFAASGYMLQTSAGDTGTITPTISYGSAGTYPYGIILLALRVKQAAIDLSATFPSSPHVGDAVSFDVTATLVDGATGSPTITVDQLPAGLTLGSTSMVDATHYKATVSGTLTTVQDITSTFGATGGSVSATALVHDFDVAAAVSAITQVGSAVIFTATSGNLPLPTGCQAGDVLVIVNRGGGMPAPSGFTTILALSSYGTSGRKSAIYAKALTSTDITNGYITVASDSNTCTASAWRNVDNTTLTNAVGTLGTGPAVAGDVIMTAPGITTTVDGCMLLYFGMPDANTTASGTFTDPSGWTNVAHNMTIRRAHTVDALLQTSKGATGDITASYAVSGTWAWGAIVIALKPA